MQTPTTKAEIAKLYRPSTTKRTVFLFFREVHNCPELMESLKKIGYRKTNRMLTTPMLKEIKKHFGDWE